MDKIYLNDLPSRLRSKVARQLATRWRKRIRNQSIHRVVETMVERRPQCRKPGHHKVLVKLLTHLGKQVVERGLLDRWEKADNYIGPNYAEYYCGPAITRDSTLIEQSNYNVALERLGGERGGVVVESSGHWACGWVDALRVHNTAHAQLGMLYCIALSAQLPDLVR